MDVSRRREEGEDIWHNNISYSITMLDSKATNGITLPNNISEVLFFKEFTRGSSGYAKFLEESSVIRERPDKLIKFEALSIQKELYVITLCKMV